jgi:antitoxin (DNA-binding transcriptional repressor) of toxin-antitoxin stability system
METISMLEIRRNAKGLVRRLAHGECFRITYRNHPVGELFPPTSKQGVTSKDPVYCLAETAEDLGGGLDARKADELIYRG